MSQTISQALLLVDNQNMVTVQADKLDYRNSQAVKQALSKLIDTGMTELLINLENVTFVDSTGLGVLLFIKRQCDGVGGRLALTSLKPYVSNLVCITNLHKTIPVLQSVPILPEHF